jgi:FkbM family methyltransferase
VLDYFKQKIPLCIKAPIKRWLGLPPTRLNKDWNILLPIGPNYSDHIMIDVGAYRGWFYHCWLDWCPNAKVHAFEPYAESFEIAQKLYGQDKRVSLECLAIGDVEGVQALNILSDSKASNSLLQPRSETWSEIRYRTGKVLQTTVPVVTLDGYIRRENLKKVYLLKIDVQGYEMHVLRGAQQNLAQIDNIFVESAVRPLYHGAAKFSEVFDFLTARGFHLIGMRGWHRGNHALVEVDMLFRRNELMTPVDESVERITERHG